MSRRIVLSGVVALCVSALSWASEPTKPARPQTNPSKPDRSFGTAVQWASSLDSAAKKADKEKKLLMVLAVAGHFEDPFFT
jgi:hypothetical protein